MGKYIIEGIGIIGMIIVLSNLYLLETGKEKANSKMYLTIGLVGSIILVAYSIILGSFSFIVLNLAFVGVNLYFLMKLKTSKKTKKSRRRK